MQGLTDSGVTSNTGVRLSPTRRRDVSRKFQEGGIRHRDGRPKDADAKRARFARSFNPKNRQPASQNDDRIRVIKTASNRP